MNSLKQAVKEHLLRQEYDAVLDGFLKERTLVRAILSLLYDADLLARWRAVTLIGRLAVSAPEKVRPLTKRFIWWMNDESGGIGWSAAPALGEIGRMAPALLTDSVRVVIHYRQERFLLPGVFWAAGRLVETYRPEVEETTLDLTGYLEDHEAMVRGTAAWALGEIGDQTAVESLKKLLEDVTPMRVYAGEQLEETTIGKVSAEAIEKISAG